MTEKISKCSVFNDIKAMPETLGISIEEASNAAMIEAVPLRLLQRFWFCGQTNVYRCNKTDCLAHVDYDGE